MNNDLFNVLETIVAGGVRAYAETYMRESGFLCHVCNRTVTRAERFVMEDNPERLGTTCVRCALRPSALVPLSPSTEIVLTAEGAYVHDPAAPVALRKLETPAAPDPNAPPKRKRGRPRKNPLPVEAAPPPPIVTPEVKAAAERDLERMTAAVISMEPSPATTEAAEPVQAELVPCPTCHRSVPTRLLAMHQANCERAAKGLV